MAQLALAGGQFGGGFNAPPVNTPRAGYDFTAEFRERVSSCSSLPTGVSPGENVSIVMRVFLNRDGTLASRPQLMQPITSAKQKALIQSSISALATMPALHHAPAGEVQSVEEARSHLLSDPLSFAGGAGPISTARD